MRHVRNGSRVTAMALTATLAVMVAGCATASARAGAASTFPAVFAASFSYTSPTADHGDLGERIALLSARTGDLLRWLTPRQDGTFDTVLSVRDGWVYFLRGGANVSIWRVPVAGGRTRLVRPGAAGCALCPDAGYAVSPDGRAVAYVISADHGDVLELVARNLATGQQNTIIMATKPSPGANNWPPGLSGLSWAPDDVHLAVQFYPTAAINSVLVFDAFTARTLSDGRAAPSSCRVTNKPVCEEFDPAYLASGALTYVTQRISATGTASASLVKWQSGRLTTLLSFPAAPSAFYDMTPQGQAIWADAPANPDKSWTIWRWSGGTPVKITALPPPCYGLGGIAW
ncbi:MAG TPA: hypothetical protein VMA97_12300 [Streptosporangiaceae bacterium]|nr:hypothetical protein [Streptosporangiaceae bacterium]